MFWKRAPKIEYRIVEVERPARMEPPTAEMKEMLKTLQFNPAFQYLMNRFRFMRAEIDRRLKQEGPTAPEIALKTLLASSIISEWFEHEIKRLTQEGHKPSVVANEDVTEAFRRMSEAIEGIK